MNQTIPRAKRAFDIVAGSLMTLFLLPLLMVLAIGIAILEGRPVFYISQRRLNSGPPEPVMKFRTMRRDADRIANRDTVQVSSTRFLNLPVTSPLYTSIGRFIERFMLTEMPQLLHVLQGRMSIVGNRPLPENVVASLREEFSYVEQRFLTPGGLTGPVQLVGRDFLTDEQRLEIEISYCHAVLNHYSVMLDLNILAMTIVGGLCARARLTPDEALAMIARGRQADRAAAPRRNAKPHKPDLNLREQVVREKGSGNR